MERDDRVRMSFCAVRAMPAAFALLALAGCTRPINRAAERRIRDLLPQALGPANSYQVHVSGSPFRTASGRLHDVTIDGQDVQLGHGMLLDELDLHLQGVDVDTLHKRLKGIRSASFAATVGATTLDEYFAGENPQGADLRNVAVHFAPGNHVVISGDRMVLGVGVPFTVSGPVRPEGGRRLELDATALRVAGIPLGGVVLGFVKDHFDSAVDLSQLPFGVRITGVATSAGKLTLSGAASTAAILAAAH
ncbi:MAG: DUF2993 domain-containing protein [Armatimonadetes bacterium]|nr:DUF2993 domain-containing protein [Armatimonadota bacterium]MDE2207681.1 DUF2993 domain-containing protein [Armatimonadota bacterium]